MKLGFHYHLVALHKEDEIFVQSFFGVFLDSLAEKVSELHLFLHSPVNHEFELLDYRLEKKNIFLHYMGPHTSMPFRLLTRNYLIDRVFGEMIKLDAFLLRGPSPLTPFISLRLKGYIPVAILLVGNYTTIDDDPSLQFWKNYLIRLFNYYIHYFQNKAVKNVRLFVNSELLFQENKYRNEYVKIIKTTTLSNSNFYKKSINELNWDKIKVIYTGRIDLTKGILLIANALSNLKNLGFDVEFHLVGWESNNTSKVRNDVIKFCKGISFEKFIFFHGKKKIGPELDTMYRGASIFVNASTGSEGFPRTIWEAMANSLPVVVTSVGSIPYFLKNRENALIIEPKSVKAIEDAIRELIEDFELRIKLVENGYNLALTNTLEIQAEKLVCEIKLSSTD